MADVGIAAGAGATRPRRASPSSTSAGPPGAAIPEAIYCEGKTPEQVRDHRRAAVRGRRRDDAGARLFTRAGAEHAAAVLERAAGCLARPDAAAAGLAAGRLRRRAAGWSSCLCAGTSDLPVAREAVLTARYLGRRDRARRRRRRGRTAPGAAPAASCIRRARVDRRRRRHGRGAAERGRRAGRARPVVAVPTSVGYGAAFEGLAAAAGDAQRLRPRGRRGQHRQRLRRRPSRRADRRPLTRLPSKEHTMWTLSGFADEIDADLQTQCNVLTGLGIKSARVPQRLGHQRVGSGPTIRSTEVEPDPGRQQAVRVLHRFTDREDQHRGRLRRARGADGTRAGRGEQASTPPTSGSSRSSCGPTRRPRTTGTR